MYKKYTLGIAISKRQFYQIFKIMRITAVILIATLMQVSASSFGQRISIQTKNAYLPQLIKEIRNQSGYDFFYDNGLIKKVNPVTVNIRNATISEVLEICFKDQPLIYSIENKVVLLKEKPAKPSEGLNNTISHFFNNIDVDGQVLNEKGIPLEGATIRVKNGKKTVVTNKNGYFLITGVSDTSTLIISFIGYKKKEILAYQDNKIIINLELITSDLDSVNVIVSTGYQTLPKERATGSFESIDNKLFNRTNGYDVISRINGLVPGVFFSKKSAGSLNISSLTIRGLSSFSGPSPLIILDNLPYDGDLNNLNPNDVDNISILKDAAAASIWGARAGNGVIVITTKKGNYNKRMVVSLNSNLTISNKPDLFYIPQINSSDFVDLQKFLFTKNYYNSKINRVNPYPPFLTPVVELLAKQRALPMSDYQGRADIDSQINSYRQYDVRNDYEKYVYRNQILQQYALNLSGGSDKSSYYISGGYDKSLNSLITSRNDRITLKTNYNFKPIKNLEIQTSAIFNSSTNNDIGPNSVIGYRQGLLQNPYPFARLADDNGKPVEPGGPFYKLSYLNSLDNNSTFLDWHYKPLEDIYKSRIKTKSDGILLNLGALYDINSFLSATVKYQYELNYSNSDAIYDSDSYYVRDLINSFIDPTTLKSPIPLGDIYNPSNSHSSSQTLRGQLNFNKAWNSKNQIIAIGGSEIRRSSGYSNNEGYRYGYNSETKNFIPVDFTNSQLQQYYGGVNGIPYQESFDESKTRFTSLFANVSYTYFNKYILSASTRKDASNVFGVNSNRRGRPLWSTGVAWNISEESFYKSVLLPYLKLRITYGTSGNTITSVPAFSVVTYGLDPTTFMNYSRGQNLPNPDLRWEKVGMLNIGLDFRFINNRINGSLEYYDKRSTDLIAESPIDPTLSFSTQMYNAANLHGRGIDVNIKTNNISLNNFQWNTNFLLSYNRTQVTKYLLKLAGSINYVGRTTSVNPLEGKDASAVFAYPWAGLDPTTGDPRGFVNGQISKDYDAILGGSVADMKYIGPATPVYYGAIRNSLSFKWLTISTNILYKFGYYFNRPGLNYSQLFSSNYGHSEFASRWQKSGDENHTNVPSMIYPSNPSRNSFYNLSSVLVEKGDHIRLQDITVDYIFNKVLGLSSIRLYGNVSNLGIIWRANKQGIDPDILSGYPNPFTMAFGLNATF